MQSYISTQKRDTIKITNSYFFTVLLFFLEIEIKWDYHEEKEKVVKKKLTVCLVFAVEEFEEFYCMT